MAVTTITAITATGSTRVANPADRQQHRAATRDLRDNAGIDLREHVEAVADFGAAARRLRESVRGGDDGPMQRRCETAVVRAAAAAATSADYVRATPPVEVGPVIVARKRESVTLKYLRTRKAGQG